MPPPCPAEPLAIALPGGLRVASLLQRPAQPWALYVMAHGAGAGMQHPFMAQLAAAVAAHGIAVLRYQFPYMQRGERRPDPPQTCHATVRAAVATAVALDPELPLLAGGKSFGARMCSQAQAIEPLPAVRGLVCLSFPLHPAKHPSVERAAQLAAIEIPMLFVQGSRDALADGALLRSALAPLGSRAALIGVDAADHGLHVPARSGRNDAEVLQWVAAQIVRWGRQILA